MGAVSGKPKPTPVEELPGISQPHPYTERFEALDAKLEVLQTDLRTAMNNDILNNAEKVKIKQKITEMTLQLNKEFSKLESQQCRRNAKQQQIGGKKISTTKPKSSKKQLRK